MLFTALVVLLVVVQIAGSILLGIQSVVSAGGLPGDVTDERDRIIGLRSTRNGAYVLATGVFVSLTLAVFTDGNFLFTHVLLGFWVVAQLVEIGSQLFQYRRGA